MNRPRCFGRDIHGVLLLDKPKGISSNNALQEVKRIFRANRAGHTGSLDPIATGMLPICFGEATKFSQYLLDADKRYHVVARLGERTNTSDADGKIINVRPVIFGENQLHTVLDSLRVQTKQIPSMYSALKYRGYPLYEYARKGIEICRVARVIHIYKLQCIRYQKNEIELEIHCSKGTYIRTIIDDLGEKLGCGAHVIMLRRIQVSHYPINRMVTLKQLYILKNNLNSTTYPQLDALLMPIDSPVINYPEVNLNEIDARYFKQGKLVQYNNLPDSKLTRVTEGEMRKFIGIAEIIDYNHIAPKRLVVEYSS